jgi:tetratricopeptide (TPR) repeat protein
MKTVFKVLACAAMLMAFAVVPALAQQEECEALYKKYTDNYKGTLAQRKTAVEAGDQYISKCGTLEGNAEINKYLTEKIPPIKKKIDFEETVAAFDASVKDAKNVNADVAFSSGKKLLTVHDPNLVDVMLVLASVGFDKAVAKPPVDTYNADAVSMAKQAIQKIESGATSKQFGAWGFTYKTKENALAWMNYTVGYITYFNQKNKKEAIPYLFKATRYETGAKDNPKNLPLIYQAIGDYYKDEYNRLDDERASLAEQAKGKTPEEAKPLADKAKELLLLQKGYAERMIDAYGRARTLATTDKAYQDALYANLKVLYGFRFDGNNATGLDSYVSGLVSKPMPDPTSAVTPVPDTTPATTNTTATTPSTTSSTLTTTPTSNTTNNARTSTTTDATTTKAKTATTTTKTTPAKTTTPAPKKKGTR